MQRQRDALLKLLQEEDRETLALVKAQLASGGVGALPELHALLASAEGAARTHVREVIERIEYGNADAVFQRLCESFGEHGNLEQAAWRLAATFLPSEDFAPARALLDAWGAEVARRLGKAATEQDRIETLVEFLGQELGLRGNEEDYYNVTNSLLPEVIETRRGIPITLSLVYMLVGRRAGLAVEGVGLPGHFIVRYGAAFFDPFHGGRRIGLEECRLLLEQRKVVLTAAHLEPATSRQILARMLANLHGIAEESDPPLAAKIAGWIEGLQGGRG